VKTRVKSPTLPETLRLKNIYRKVEDLKPYAGNARTHSEKQIEQIAASIRQFSFVNPVLTDADDGIVAGHGRVAAARKLACNEVPIIGLAHLSEAERRASVIAGIASYLQLELGQEHFVDNVDNAIGRHDICRRDVCIIHADSGTVLATGTVDMDGAALHRRDVHPGAKNLVGRHCARHNVIGENACELIFVFRLQESFHRAFRQSGEGRICRCKDGERARAFQSVHQTGSLNSGDERREFRIRGRDINDIVAVISLCAGAH